MKMCWIPLRYQMLLLCTLCLTALLSNILVLHFTMLCMVTDLQYRGESNVTQFPVAFINAARSTTTMKPSSKLPSPGLPTPSPTTASLKPSTAKSTAATSLKPSPGPVKPSPSKLSPTESVKNPPNTSKGSLPLNTTSTAPLPILPKENDALEPMPPTVGNMVVPTSLMNIEKPVDPSGEKVINKTLLASVGKSTDSEGSLPIAQDIVPTVPEDATVEENVVVPNDPADGAAASEAEKAGNKKLNEAAPSQETTKASLKLIKDELLQDLLQLNGVPQLGTHIEEEIEYTFAWGPVVKSSLFSAFAWGALLAVIPCSWLIQRFGCRVVLPVVSSISALATVLSPSAAYLGVPYLIACRILQGIGFSILFPVAGAVAAQWAPLDENGIFLGMMTSCIQLAPVFTMPLAGHLCESDYGWPSVFYIHGAVTMLLATLWFFVFRNQPGEHPRIRGDELHKILHDKSLAQRHNTGSHFSLRTIGHLMTSLPILVVLVAAFGNMCGIQLLVLYLPTYLVQVLKFDLLNTGVLSAVPTLLQFVVKLVSGYVSDVGTCCSQVCRLRIYNTLALVGMGACYIVVALLPQSMPDMAFSFLALGAALLGCNCGGFFKSAVLVSRQYSATVMGLIQLITCLVIVVLPFYVTALAPNNHYLEFRIIFLIIAGILVLSNVLFCVLCSSEAASWTKEKEKDKTLNGKEPEEASLLEGILEMNVIKPTKA